jgi:flagellar assembly factor FliW
MRIDTQRFGTISLDQDQLFLFPAGLIGMEALRDWALLPDLENPSVAWLQSASRGDRALPLISPRAFFPDYRVQVTRRELNALHLKPGAEIYVLTTIASHGGKVSTNLRAPLVINLNRRLGCQVVTDNDQPIQKPLPGKTVAVRPRVAGTTQHSVQASVSAFVAGRRTKRAA